MGGIQTSVTQGVSGKVAHGHNHGDADDVIHQELRAIGENSTAEGQVLPKFLDISKDPPPPSAEEFTQASPEERAERHERFESRSSGHVQQESSAQPHNPDGESPSDGTLPNAEGSEMEKSETTRRRIAGKRELLRMMCPYRRRRNALVHCSEPCESVSTHNFRGD